MRTEEEVQKMCDEATDAGREPSKLAGMSYEQGVEAALEWVLENPDYENPVKGE